jgi:hypothetical protein
VTGPKPDDEFDEPIWEDAKRLLTDLGAEIEEI